MAGPVAAPPFPPMLADLMRQSTQAQNNAYEAMWTTVRCDSALFQQQALQNVYRYRQVSSSESLAQRVYERALVRMDARDAHLHRLSVAAVIALAVCLVTMMCAIYWGWP